MDFPCGYVVVFGTVVDVPLPVNAVESRSGNVICVLGTVYYILLGFFQTFDRLRAPDRHPYIVGLGVVIHPVMVYYAGRRPLGRMGFVNTSLSFLDRVLILADMEIISRYDVPFCGDSL